MSDTAVDEERLRTFLLGELPESERDALEARLLADQALFEQAGAVEDDLCDAYAAGTLAPAERRAFEARLAQVRRLRDRVAAARDLDGASRKLRPRATLAARVKALLTPPPGAARWALATGVVAALATAAALQRPDALTVGYALRPGTTRSADGPQRIQVPPRAAVAALRLDVETRIDGRFRARLYAASGVQVAAADGVLERDPGGFGWADLELPASLLEPGSYELRLEALGAGSPAPLGTYRFEVVRSR
jgi:hypothetical protein